ncbi:WhiB family transcriptional regulator [Streptomyces candidus]|uniref:WhiB family transcriptional regulator n=1 Tax=Streptomyces candidus TaxID=67283 RepID=UPI001C87E749|nr:WhiB family transcriptional regulator [Streptomyces candidus]
MHPTVRTHACYALDEVIEFGVWGGMTERERRALRRRRPNDASWPAASGVVVESGYDYQGPALMAPRALNGEHDSPRPCRRPHDGNEVSRQRGRPFRP